MSTVQAGAVLLLSSVTSITDLPLRKGLCHDSLTEKESKLLKLSHDSYLQRLHITISASAPYSLYAATMRYFPSATIP